MNDDKMMNDLDKLVTEKHKLENEIREMCKEKGSKILASIFKELFDHTDCVAVHWVQFTPYFNDGDTCEFTLHDPFFLPKKDDQGNTLNPNNIEEYDLYRYERSDWDPNSYLYKNSEEKPYFCTENNSDYINYFTEKFFELEEVLEIIFGDHVSITVTMNDSEVVFNVESYDHD